MPRCPECDAPLRPRTVWSGFTLARPQWGRIVCPRCAAKLELTPASGVLQAVLTILAGLLLVAAGRMLPPGMPQALLATITLVLLVSVCVASYLFLSRFRARC
jgi:hypothetical protein